VVDSEAENVMRLNKVGCDATQQSWPLPLNDPQTPLSTGSLRRRCVHCYAPRACITTTHTHTHTHVYLDGSPSDLSQEGTAAAHLVDARNPAHLIKSVNETIKTIKILPHMRMRMRISA
jgi:hypothetical protein